MRSLAKVGLSMFLCFAAGARAQQPVSPAPTAGPRSPIETMSPADVQQALQILKDNYVDPNAVGDAEIERAKLEGVLHRLGRGAELIGDDAAASKPPPAPLYNEVIAGHVGYVRVGDVVRANLDALNKALQSFSADRIDAVILDLRASGTSTDFETAAEFAKRFVPKGKMLFSLRRPVARQERTFTADRDPAFTGLVIVLTDGDTSGASEVLAAVLRTEAKALIIGAHSAGRAVEYSDFKVGGGRTLRLAVAEPALPEKRSIFPEGIAPDLPVDMPAAEKREIFQQSREKGMATFVVETERPHMNEAALIAGKNPELDALEAQRRAHGNDKSNLRDPVLQRALDVVTSISVYQHR